MVAGGGGSSSDSGGGSSESNEDVKLTATELYISDVNGYTINILNRPSDCKSIKWSSSDEKVAYVNSKGYVKTNGKTGKATVKATIKTKSGKEIKLECKVRVVKTKIDYYTSDNDGKKKLKVLLDDNKGLDDVLPKGADRAYKWKGSGITLDKNDKGRPVVTKITDNAEIDVMITDKLGENDSGVRIKLEADRTIKKNTEAHPEDQSGNGQKTKEKIQLFATKLYLTTNTSYDNATNSTVIINGKTVKFSKLGSLGYSIKWAVTSGVDSLKSLTKDGKIESSNKEGTAKIKANLFKNGKYVTEASCKVYVVKCRVKVDKDKKYYLVSDSKRGNEAIGLCRRREEKSGYLIYRDEKGASHTKVKLQGSLLLIKP